MFGVSRARPLVEVEESNETTHKIITKQQHTLLLPGNSEHQHRADNGWHTGRGNDQALALEPLGEPASAEDGDELDGAKGDVEENGLEAVVAKRLYNQRAKSCDAAA